MPRHARLLLSLAASASLAAGTLAVAGTPGQAAPADARSAAVSKLKADASSALTLRAGAGGTITFAGVKAGKGLDVPGVSASTGVQDAADAAVARYGPAFGTAQRGTTLAPMGAQSAVTGDVVRYRQEVGGLPVLGGELVVSLGADRSTRSILGEVSRATSVADAKVTEAQATDIAREAFLKVAGKGAAPKVASRGRWVLDPSLVGLAPERGIRSGWRFEVTRDAHERRMVIVDDVTGSLLLNTDMINHALNRIVCDNAEVPRVGQPDFDEFPCTDPATAARYEGGPVHPVTDVNVAYDLAAAVSNTYAGVGVDLTALIGRELTGTGAGQKALAQTVRMCYVPADGGCPYANAFWNGKQMYYGTGFAVADDVVGHEMTHGVTERTSNLIYFGQSGAMNESISDIMGEIVDHQRVDAGDANPANAWGLGEDIPGLDAQGGIRDMRDPTKFGNADKTSSPLWVRDDALSVYGPYPDNDGVHQNSGVGNKTFYLISQGGTFNGQTISGIDAGDPNLTKSAKLWMLVDQTLSSGSDYADMAAVLEQSCATLQAAGAMTAANCEAVHKGTLATELRETPLNAAQPDDAELSCPGTAAPRVLLDSETGDPMSKFTPGPAIVDTNGPGPADDVSFAWSRDGIEGWGPNAKSKPGSWAIGDASAQGASSLVAATGIALPAGRAAYLHFQHWWVLDYDYGNVAYDAGTVEVDAGAGPVPTASLSWANGPEHIVYTGSSNPAAGKRAFGGDSRGYLASRVDLSSFAGKTVKPQFTLNTDSSVSLVGWYVDDIKVYTCDPRVKIKKVVAKGQAVVGKKLRAKVKGLQDGAKVTYQWLRNGKEIKGADGKRYKLKARDAGKKIKVVVTATAPTYAPAVEESKGRKVKKKK